MRWCGADGVGGGDVVVPIIVATIECGEGYPLSYVCDDLVAFPKHGTVGTTGSGVPGKETFLSGNSAGGAYGEAKVLAGVLPAIGCHDTGRPRAPPIWGYLVKAPITVERTFELDAADSGGRTASGDPVACRLWHLCLPFFIYS